MQEKFDSFKLKSKVYCNMGSLDLLEKVPGTRAFIVADAIMGKLGYLQKAIDALSKAGISSIVFTGVHPDPDVQVIANAMQSYQSSQADVLVAIGGGSAIDAAKAIMYFACNLEAKEGKQCKKPTFVAIPSTSGTGSEVTDFTVITSNGAKVCLIDDFLAPDIAILDSSCIAGLPQRIITDTGVDVLVHAIEAYVSVNATDFTDGLAEKAIRLIFDYLPLTYKDSYNSTARNHVQNASCIAGMAFTNAGLGIVHSLAHAFGGAFHVPHGRSNALLLNAVMEYNANLMGNGNDYAMTKYAQLGKMLGLPARTPREGCVSFMQAVDKLRKSLGVEDNLRALGLKEDEFMAAIDRMATNAMGDRCTPTNPRKPTKEDLMNIYKKMY